MAKFLNNLFGRGNKKDWGDFLALPMQAGAEMGESARQLIEDWKNHPEPLTNGDRDTEQRELAFLFCFLTEKATEVILGDNIYRDALNTSYQQALNVFPYPAEEIPPEYLKRCWVYKELMNYTPPNNLGPYYLISKEFTKTYVRDKQYVITAAKVNTLISGFMNTTLEVLNSLKPKFEAGLNKLE